MPRVRLFSHLAQVLGSRELVVKGTTLGAALQALLERFGDDLRERLPGCTVLINERRVDPQRDAAMPLGPDDELALLPPAAGG